MVVEQPLDGKALAQVIEGQATINNLDLSGIVDRVRPLDWLHARAVAAVLAWERKHGRAGFEREGFWTLAYRND